MTVRRPLAWSLIGMLLSSWLFGIVAATPPTVAASDFVMVRHDPGSRAYLYRGAESVETYIARPAALEYLRAQTATISVEYVDFPAEAQAAFQAAVEIWQALLNSPVPISVVAYWEPLEEDVLGGAGTINSFANFEGAPQSDTFYPSALANKLAGGDLAPGEPDIEAVFNSTLTDWYFGTGQTPRNELNFVSTVVHELGHGLGFAGTASVRNGLGQWGSRGLPRAYDRNVVNAAGVSIIDTTQFPNPSAALAAQFQGGNLFWGGARGAAADNGNRPKLYAPASWQQGSSYSHLDERTYAAGTPNSLMTPALASGETVLDPGPIALGMLADMGWTIEGGPGPSDPSQLCFAETSKCLKGRFATYWLEHGGLAQQGYPITDEFEEVNPTDGKKYLTQYTERARFEYHPENAPPFDVLLGLLGREQLARYKGDIPATLTNSPLGTECATFEQTGKKLCGVFLDYWEEHGGLAQQGLPLTDLFLETNPTDGKQYPTQYTERARFEYHVEHINTPYVVLLGLLGSEQFKAKYPNGIPGGPSPSPSGSPGASPSASPSGSPSPVPGARLSVTPNQGPNSTLFIVTGTGFAPNTTYYLQIAKQDGSGQINFSDASLRSNGQGIIAEGFKPSQSAAAGDYVARITSAPTGGTIFASANFRLTGPSGPAVGAHLSVTPPEGLAGGTIFVAVGTGFTPGASYTFRIQTEDRQTTIPFDNPNVFADADGVIITTFSLASGRPTGLYIAEAITKETSPQVVAGATFRITGNAPPPSASPSASPSGSPSPVPSPSSPGAWGPTLAPLAGGQVYSHASGRFTVSMPNSWEVLEASADEVAFGIESPEAVCIAGAATLPVGGTLADLDAAVGELNGELANYQQITKDQVLVRGQQAYRRVVSYTLQGTQVREEQVYFIAGHLFALVYCAALPPDFAGFAPAFDGIAGSMKLSTMALKVDPTADWMRAETLPPAAGNRAWVEGLLGAEQRALIARLLGAGTP